tara:strand:- start:227 stop:1051 length:825 start_codon:yes stop_codon:yes gene_type:complete
MMVGQENLIKMKAKPIPKELIDKIELRVGDIEIPPNDHYGFEGYLLKDVLVPYVGDKRVGHIVIQPKKQPYYELRYYVANGLNENGNPDDYRFNRIAYIILNKDDPRVIETQDYYDIEYGFVVDHDKDIPLQDSKFIIKPDTKKNLQLLTYAENAEKAVKKKNNIPKHIYFATWNTSWSFDKKPSKANPIPPKKKSFSILEHGWEGSYIKIVDYCNEMTGSNHIPDLNEAIPKDFKGMTEREVHDKYYQGGNKFYKKKKQINPDDQLDLGLSLA